MTRFTALFDNSRKLKKLSQLTCGVLNSGLQSLPLITSEAFKDLLTPLGGSDDLAWQGDYRNICRSTADLRHSEISTKLLRLFVQFLESNHPSFHDTHQCPAKLVKINYFGNFVFLLNSRKKTYYRYYGNKKRYHGISGNTSANAENQK